MQPKWDDWEKLDTHEAVYDAREGFSSINPGCRPDIQIVCAAEDHERTEQCPDDTQGSGEDIPNPSSKSNSMQCWSRVSMNNE